MSIETSNKYQIYAIALILCIISGFIALALQDKPGEHYMWIPLSTFAASAIVALLRLMLDLSKHQIDILLQDRREFFEVSASGYMAEQVFSRYCDFAEEYTSKVQDVFKKLMAEGDTQAATGYANELAKIRVSHTLWLTDDVNERLETIEKILREIGGNQRLYEARGDLPGRDLLYESFEKFSQIMHLPGQMGIRNEQRREKIEGESLIGIITFLRDTLRVNELTNMRNTVIDKALGSSKG